MEMRKERKVADERGRGKANRREGVGRIGEWRRKVGRGVEDGGEGGR